MRGLRTGHTLPVPVLKDVVVLLLFTDVSLIMNCQCIHSQHFELLCFYRMKNSSLSFNNFKPLFLHESHHAKRQTLSDIAAGFQMKSCYFVKQFCFLDPIPLLRKGHSLNLRQSLQNFSLEQLSAMRYYSLIVWLKLLQSVPFLLLLPRHQELKSESAT